MPTYDRTRGRLMAAAHTALTPAQTYARDRATLRAEIRDLLRRADQLNAAGVDALLAGAPDAADGLWAHAGRLLHLAHGLDCAYALAVAPGREVA